MCKKCFELISWFRVRCDDEVAIASDLMRMSFVSMMC